MNLLERGPDKLLRSLALTATAISVFVPLSLLGPRTTWWQHPLVVLAFLLLVGAYALLGESMPELIDSEGAQRLHRSSPLVPPALLLFVLLFPDVGRWGLLWALYALNAILLLFAYVPRVRLMALLTTSVAALGLTVLDDAATWCLAPVGLAWLVVPSLDRLSVVRYQLDRRVRPSVLPALVASLALFGTGLAVFLLGVWLLPRSTRGFGAIDLFEAQGKMAEATKIDLPVLELFSLAVLVLLALYFISRIGLRKRERGLGSAEGLSMAFGASRPLELEDPEVAVAGWPQGTRRTLVREYLEHLRRLRQLGRGRERGETPHGVADRAPPAAREAAGRLARLFGRARWSPEEVGGDDLREAARARREVEDQLRSS